MQTRHSFPRLGVAVLCLALMAGAGVADDWPSWSGRDTARTRCSEEPILVDGANPFVMEWWKNTNSLIVSSPAVSNGLVFVGTTSGRILALREDTGEVAWEYAAPNAVRSSPFVERDRVFFVCQDGRLYALRASTGVLLWQLALGGSPMSSPVVAGSILIVGTGFPSPRVLAIDISGAAPAIVWQIAVTGVVYSSAAIVGNGVFIGSNSGKHYAFNATNGSNAWALPFATSGIVNFSSPVAHAGWLFAAPGGIDNKLYRANAGTGLLAEPTLNLRPDGHSMMVVSSPARIGDTVFVVAGNLGAPSTALQVWAVNSSTMQPVWGPMTHGDTDSSAALASTPAGTNPAVASGAPAAIFFTTQSSRQLVARRANDGELLAAATVDSAVFSSPAIANARVFVASANGTVYAFRGQNRPPAPPTAMSPANDITVFTSTPLIAWSGEIDPDGDALSYVLRYDFDGEVLDSWAAEVEVPAGQGAYVFSAPIANNTRVSYAIRARDSRRAFSRWTATEHFWVDQTMAPPVEPIAEPAAPVAQDEPLISPPIEDVVIVPPADAGAAQVAPDEPPASPPIEDVVIVPPADAGAAQVAPDEPPASPPIEDVVIVPPADASVDLSAEPLPIEDSTNLDVSDDTQSAASEGPGASSDITVTAPAPCPLIVRNSRPVLTWLKRGVFHKDGAYPDSANAPPATFQFAVRYADADNLAPAFACVQIDMNDNGTFESAETFPMSAYSGSGVASDSDGNHANGEAYYAAVTLGFAGDGVLRYRFVFHDGARSAGLASDPICFSSWYEDSAFAIGLASGEAAGLQDSRQTVRIHAPKRGR